MRKIVNPPEVADAIAYLTGFCSAKGVPDVKKLKELVPEYKER